MNPTPEQRAVKAIDDAYALDGVTAQQAAAGLKVNPYRAASVIAAAIREAVNAAYERAAARLEARAVQHAHADEAWAWSRIVQEFSREAAAIRALIEPTPAPGRTAGE